MAQYTIELSWDAVSLTPSSPVTAAWDQNDPLAGVLVRGVLHDNAGTPQFVGLQLLLYAHSYGGGPTYELITCQRPWNSGLSEFSLGTPFIPNPAIGFFQASNGEAGSTFLNAALQPMLSILVDDGANSVTYTGSLGTYVATFASLGWANGTLTDIALNVIAGVMTPPTSTGTHAFQLALDGFYLSFGGEPIAGAELGSLQPGVWVAGPWQNLSIGAPGGTVGLTDGTTETRLLMAFLWDPAVNNPGIFEALAQWDTTGGNHLADIELLLHALRHPDEGVLLYARIIKQHVNAVEVGTSRDLGHTWTTQLVGKAGGRFYVSPSLSTSPDGTLNLFVNDRSVKFTRWFKSYDFGMSWQDAGSLLPLLPWANITHPKVFTLSNGFFLLTFNQSGHFWAQAFDNGAGTGVSLHDFGGTAGGFDTYPAIWQDDRGITYVAFEGAAIETEMRSLDFGVDWDLVYSAALLSQQIVMVKDSASAFLWKLFQAPSSGGVSDLLIQASADAGLTALTSAVVVEAAIVEQYSALVVAPLGQVIALRQVYNSGTDHWNLRVWISADFGQTFTLA